MRQAFHHWLGLSRGPATAGLAITDSQVSMVVVRTRPLRVTAIGRRCLPPGPVVDREVRVPGPVARVVAELVADLGIGSDVAVTLAIDPPGDRFEWGPGREATPLAEPVHDRVVAVATQAQLRLAGVEPLPMCLLRPALAGWPEAAVVAGPSGWALLWGGGHAEGERRTDLNGRFRVGGDFASLRTPDSPPVRTMGATAAVFDADLDVVALGAALGGQGIGPPAGFDPVPVPRGDRWAVRPVPTDVPRHEAVWA
jgi:hypothetical protein